MENQYSHSSHSSNKGFLDAFPPKTAFVMGFVGAILVLGTVGFVILGAQTLKGDSDSVAAAPTPSAIAPTAAAPDPVPVGNPAAVTDEDHIRGNKDAKVTLIEYSDFECPFCSRFHPTAQQVMDEYGDDVRWVYRHFPLSFHPNSEAAAEAAECAGEQGKFWEYGDKLFENQTALSPTLYTKLAADLGLNASKFQDCLDSDKFLQKIRAQAQEGASAGVTGTPGSFVVGSDGSVQVIKGALPYESVKQFIDSAL